MSKRLILSINQINEVLAGNLTEQTWIALREFLTLEKQRREKVAQNARKPRIYTGTAKERNLQAVNKFRNKEKSK